MLKASQMFLKWFYGKAKIWLKYFHDSLNIALILAPGRKFFGAKYVVQLPLTFTEWN